MRTQDELVIKYKSISQDLDGIIGAMTGSDILIYMDYEHAEPFLKEDTSKEEWDAAYEELTDEKVIKSILDYLPFAHEKIINKRGISANRNVFHFLNWIWLLRDDEFYNKVDTEYKEHYDNYGMSIYEMVKEKYSVFSKKEEEKKETVNHPKHYQMNIKGMDIEALDIIDAVGWSEGHNRANALTYILRAGKKNKDTELEDLKKAEFYIKTEINRLTKIKEST